MKDLLHNISHPVTNQGVRCLRMPSSPWLKETPKGKPQFLVPPPAAGRGGLSFCFRSAWDPLSLEPELVNAWDRASPKCQGTSTDLSPPPTSGLPRRDLARWSLAQRTLPAA